MRSNDDLTKKEQEKITDAMIRTGLTIEQIEELLGLNQDVIDFIIRHPSKMKKYYLGGIREERMRLFFRVPEGVKNIDLDCVEIRPRVIEGQIVFIVVALIEFKHGLITQRPSWKGEQMICTRVQAQIFSDLARKSGIPVYVVMFNSAVDRFQVFKIGDQNPSFKEMMIEELWEWRHGL